MRRRSAKFREDADATNFLALRTSLIGRVSLVSLIQTLAVAEYLNFRHAANFLGVSQSSVSTRVKSLEENLGILLFERRHRGVRLTDAGRSFVAEVADGIEHLDHAITTAGALSTGAVGRVRIGLHSSIASGFLADLRRRYRQRYPDIEQVIVEGRSIDTIRQVREGALDVAFVFGAIEPPDCHSRLVWSEPLVIAIPVAHPLTAAEAILWADLVTETFLVRYGGVGPQIREHVIRRLAERDRPASIRRSDVGHDTLMHMVADGEGIALISEAAAHVPFPGIAFSPIADEPEQARFSAVWSPHNRNPALKNLFALFDTDCRNGPDAFNSGASAAPSQTRDPWQ